MTSPESKAHYNHGNTYFSEGRYEEALIEYGHAIDLDSTFAWAYCGRGMAYDELGRYSEALADYARAIELDPSYPTVYFNRGSTYNRLERHNEALADYGRVINLAPDDAQAYLNRGLTHFNLQHYKEALADFSRAIELDPAYAKAYSNRGGACYNLGDFKQALTDWRRAVDLDPRLALPYRNIGGLLLDQDELKEALFYFEKAALLGDTQASQYALQVRKKLSDEKPSGFVSMPSNRRTTSELPGQQRKERSRMNIFKRLFNKVLGRSPLNEYMQKQDRFRKGVHEYFLQANTWDDCRRALENYPELLDEENYEDILAMIAFAPGELRSRTEQRLEVLERCSEEGLEAVFRKPAANQVELLNTVTDFVNIFQQPRGLSNSRRFLEHHPELLSDSADKVLGELVAQAKKDGNHGMEQLFTTNRALLRACRKDGIEIVFRKLADGFREVGLGE